MGELGQLVPLGMGIIISPLPIVAIIAILLSPRGGRNGLAYVGAAILIGLAFTLVAALTTAGAGANGSNRDNTVVLVLTAVLTIGFTVLAIVSWLGRPRNGKTAKMPSWLTAVESLTPVKAAGLGALMAVTNSKNIPLELKAGSLIGAHDLGAPLVIALSLLFAVYASIGILLPTLLAASGSRRVIAILDRLKTEMVQHNAAIMTVLFAVLAAVEASHLIHQLVR